MEVIYALIPGMIFLGLIMVGVLIWAVKSGQYDDLKGDAQRLLMDDDITPQQCRKRQAEPTNSQQDITTPPPKSPGKNWPDAD